MLPIIQMQYTLSSFNIEHSIDMGDTLSTFGKLETDEINSSLVFNNSTANFEIWVN
jgi:hypothetical protein